MLYVSKLVWVLARTLKSTSFERIWEFFRIKGGDEDDNTVADPPEKDDWVIKAKQLSFVPSLPAANGRWWQ